MESQYTVVKLGDGVQIIEDIEAAYGIATLEGRVGPLIFGQTIRTHYLDMPARSYVDEHPHADEALTYAVRGRFVLCAGGERRLMEPGSLVWFGPDIPTGWEVPFDEPAYIMVFRAADGATPEGMLDQVEKMKSEFVEARARGAVFMLDDLPPEHPARVFARQINPGAGF